jgi:hypothetical protein
MGYKEIVNILILNKADPLIKDNEGNNANTWGNILNYPNFFFLNFDIFKKSFSIQRN